MNIFSRHEKRLLGGIGLVIAMRTLGFSILVPVFSIYSVTMQGATETLAGVAVGIFALAQTLLQVPMGRLSDIWGRKQATLLGLGIYMAGTLLGGISQDVYQLIASRALAGAGAVSGVTIAWLTDGIPLDKRNAALSYVGVSIGFSVIIGFTVSPLLAGNFGIPFLFYVSAFLIFLLILYIFCYLNNHGTVEPYEGREKTVRPGELFFNRDLMRINLLGFVANFSLAGVFFVMPLLIRRYMEIVAMWRIFVPVALIGTACMFYFGNKADRLGTVRIASVGILMGAGGLLLPVLIGGLTSYFASFVLFYSGYCILSPLMPAAVSRYPDSQRKGTVLGMLNSFQFIGSAAGGVMGGVMMRFRPELFFCLLSLLLFLSLVFLLGFRDYRGMCGEGPATS